MNPPNPPAFACPPVLDTGDDTLHAGHDGMTLRDYFAAAALTGLLSQHEGLGMVDEELRLEACYNIGDVEVAADHAYALADAMLAERAKADTNPADGV